jgi:hypothetical protein
VGLGDPAGQPAYITAALRNRWLLEEAFGVAVTHHLVHAPYPQRVSVLAEIADRFAAEIDATAHAPFRSETDVSMVSSLAPHYGLMTGSAYAASLDNAFVDLATTNVGLVLEQALKRRQDTICLGDHHDYAMEMARVDRLVAGFFERYLPIAAPWETTAS